MELSPSFDEALAGRWQELMSRWSAESSEVSELSRKLANEANPETQARIRRDLDQLQSGLVDLRVEIDALIKQGAQKRDGKGDSFTVATLYSDEEIENVPDLRHRQS